MATNQPSFHENEKFLLGRTGEKVVAEILQNRGCFVIPSYDYSGEDNDKPPRLQGTREAYPIPDLDVAKNGNRFWVEVKTKTSATLTRKTGKLEHGIPTRLLRGYIKVQEITGTKIWLFIVEKESGEILVGSMDRLLSHVRYYTENKMSFGGMAFFPRDKFKLFTNLK